MKSCSIETARGFKYLHSRLVMMELNIYIVLHKTCTEVYIGVEIHVVTRTKTEIIAKYWAHRESLSVFALPCGQRLTDASRFITGSVSQDCI
jgi:hypothetical protein